MATNKKLVKVFGSVVALAMLCGTAAISASASDSSADGNDQNSSAQQANAKAGEKNKSAKNDGQAVGSGEAATHSKPQLQSGNGNGSKGETSKEPASVPDPQAPDTQKGASSQPRDVQNGINSQSQNVTNQPSQPSNDNHGPSSSQLGQKPSKPSASLTFADGGFTFKVVDGSLLQFRSDGSYTYRSFDATTTSASPKQVTLEKDGVKKYEYPYGSALGLVMMDSDGTLDTVRFDVPGNLVAHIDGGNKNGFSMTRNDEWREQTSVRKWGSATVTRNNVFTQSGRSEGDNYFIGDGTLGSYTDAPWYSGRWGETQMSNTAKIDFTDPQHTALPADSTRMFAYQRVEAIFDMDQISKLDTSKVTNMSSMFYSTPWLTDTAALKNWDTSKVTDMSNMFSETYVSEFTALSSWNLSQVKNMARMFYDARGLKSLGDVKNLKLGSLNDMTEMFALDGDIKDVSVLGTWDTSHVTSMKGLFSGARGYQDESPSTESLTELKGVDKINMKSVTDASQMFAYNQNLKSIGGIENLQVSNVNNIDSMFCDDWALTNLDLHAWNTKNLKNASDVFAMDIGIYYGHGMTGSEKKMPSKLTSVDLSGWDTSSAENLNSMFSGCSRLTEIKGIPEWNTASMTNINAMFKNCYKLSTLDLSHWDISHLKEAGYAFQNFGKDASNVNLDSLKGWNFAGRDVKVDRMFDGCAAKTLPIAGWSMGGVRSTENMFSNMPNLKTLDVSKWDTHSNEATVEMFLNDSKLESVDVSNWDTSKLWLMDGMFSGDSSLTSVGSMAHKSGSKVWDTSIVANAFNMFKDCPKLKSLDLSGWDLSQVHSDYQHEVHEGNNTTYHYNYGIDNMFSGDSGLESLDLSGWNISKVTTTNNVFAGTSSLKTLNLSGWDASKIKSFDNTFNGAGAPEGMKLDLSGWKVNNAVSVEMSMRDANVAALDLTGWDTTANTGFQPRFSAKLRQLTVGPKTALRPEYFVAGVEPGGVTRGFNQYSGQWAEASAKSSAEQACTASDGSSYTAQGEAWSSCGRASGSSATAAMIQRANANKSEATYVWEQGALVHFAGLDAKNPTAHYDDSRMAPKKLYGADGESIKVDGSATPVDVHGMALTLPQELKADGFSNVGWLRDGDVAANISAPGTRMWVPGGEQVVRAMWQISSPSKPNKPDKPNKPSNPVTPNKPDKPNKPSNPVTPSKPDNPTKPSNPGPANGAGNAGGNSATPSAPASPKIPSGTSGQQSLSAASGVAPQATAPQANTDKQPKANANKRNNGARPEPKKKPVCVPRNQSGTSSYEIDDSGYVEPSVVYCDDETTASAQSLMQTHPAFPWWIILLVVLAVLACYVATRRNQIVYAQHRGKDDSSR
ncbi:BspA family leucine-rich repeat surface protein [Bifidobacterium sp. ESL0769]|uniref:BspA family leucine-rich repeat surface protein n=1 Tax=Bifidobacterium sp. ESL0769 TaxID=2983229 RepID=UPI0023F75B13|nr:BspA family leucine-rich repeat surface protein [Bifidobacterium sp. ESL0769]WEV67288.1 BspA family leucine-rich repeat surface protein [Bifidobacterium sp. ESL0769]